MTVGADAAGPAPDIAAELRLRPERPAVTRLSRRVIAGGAGLSAVLVAGAVIWALGTGRSGRPAEELYSTADKPATEALAKLPRDYTGLPRDVPPLGPPLPGDLGRPILASQGVVPNAVSSNASPQVDPEEQRRAQEREAARTSRLFTQTSTRGQPEPVQSAAFNNDPPAADATRRALDASDPFRRREPTEQERKQAFLNGPVDRRMVSNDRLQRPPSPYVVQAGSVIPAALITGLRSDLPGQITAQVTENVYDSPTGRFLLIPQGSRLIGTYDSQVAFGQSRVLLAWTRLILPDGRSIVLERQPGADAEGYAGLEDGVDHHWGRIATAALLATVLGVGTELGSSASGTTNNDLVRALRQGGQDSVSQTGRQLVGRNLDIQPTLTIRPGYPVRVMVTRDLVLAPPASGSVTSTRFSPAGSP